jgi:ATP-dependent DNA ligase
MLKNVNAPYVTRRGRSWLKAKTFQEREFNIVRFEDTGIGDGFVIYIVNKGREQRINCGSHQMRQKIRAGHKRVEIKFLSESEDGAMRFPSVLKLVS